MHPRSTPQRALLGGINLFVLGVTVVGCIGLFPRCARAQFIANPDVSVGASLSYPDGPGLWVSGWPLTMLTLDARVTLANVDGGATFHLPLVDDARWRHDALLTGTAGYEFDLVRLTGDATDGPRFGLMAGYGLLGEVEARILFGAVWAHRLLEYGLGPDFSASLMVGKTWL